jgi:G:T-mismatch repair DNA endonuclease (very short patch repair protein)
MLHPNYVLGVSKMLTLSNEEFISKSKDKFKDKFTYSKTNYTKYYGVVTITCFTHGDFETKAGHHLERNNGNFYECGIASRVALVQAKKFEEFLPKAKSIHGSKYDYTKVIFQHNRKEKIKIKCQLPNHGIFECSAYKHLHGFGCPKCSKEAAIKKLTHTTEQFISKAKKIHGNTYKYFTSKYKGSFIAVEIQCKKHGVFEQTPSNHLAGTGCPACALEKFTGARNYSNVSIDWINKEARSRTMKNVQHAENGGEYVLPGTRIKVDGYHARSNTVFEFHGDCFHGNLDVYKPRSKPHPFSTKTAKRLYRETKEREMSINNLGYRLIVIWENDFKLGKRYSYILN